jgi:hypothetical protein
VKDADVLLAVIDATEPFPFDVSSSSSSPPPAAAAAAVEEEEDSFLDDGATAAAAARKGQKDFAETRRGGGSSSSPSSLDNNRLSDLVAVLQVLSDLFVCCRYCVRCLPLPITPVDLLTKDWLQLFFSCHFVFIFFLTEPHFSFR